MNEDSLTIAVWTMIGTDALDVIAVLVIGLNGMWAS